MMLALRTDFPYRALEMERARVSKIDLNIVWDDAKAMGSANRDLLTAIAGMFLLLPGVIAEQLVTMPTPLADGASNEAALMRIVDYATANWPVLLVHGIITSFGALAMLSLLLRSERLTVGQSLSAALLVLPGYVIANMLQGLGVMTGMSLFLIPGLYLIGRLALIAPVAAAEESRNPLTILRRSAALTQGNGWRIFALLAIIFATMMVVGIVATSLVGLVAELLLPTDLADFAVSLVSSLLEAAVAVIIVLVSAAVYRTATASVSMLRR